MKEITKRIENQIIFDKALIALLALSLAFHSIVSFFKIENLTFTSDVLVACVSVIGVAPVILSALKALVARSVTIDLLASIALVFTLIQGEWVSAAFINLMLSSARLFSSFTNRKTDNIISKLLKLRPAIAKVQKGEHIHEVPVEKILVGDLVVVESGDRLPIDGTIVTGTGSVDQSTLTGESEPINKKAGDPVFSATLCLSGSLIVRTDKVGDDTTLSKMIALVDEASRAKTKTETIANRFSTWYVILTLIGSALVYLYTRNLNVVLSLLLVTCADDIAVAIPLGFSVAISKAARHGIIVKGAAVMERLKDIETFVTDKTGTLTKGKSKVVAVIPLNNFSEADVLEAGGITSIDSKHPISKAIYEYVHSKEKKQIHAPEEVLETPGEGMWAKHNGHEYLQGKPSFLERSGVVISKEESALVSENREKGANINMISIDGKVAGLFVLEDQIRPYAKEVIEETRNLGVKKWIILTGDNAQIAERVAHSIGITEFYADLKPADKIEHVKKIKTRHGAVAMMGDGVNDAAALALADVSFAMGSIGSDASIEAADIAIMHDDLRRVPETIYLSQEVMKIVKQNFTIWVLTNVLGLALVFTGFLGPVGASFFNFLSDFAPILNVFRIYGLKINKHSYDR